MHRRVPIRPARPQEPRALVARRVVLGLVLASVMSWPGLACADGAATGAPAPAAAVLADGGRYFGALVQGRLQGQGRVEWDNGSYYVGGFEAGRFAGQGHLHLASGDDYQGGFLQGLESGEGTLRTAHGVYRGQFRLGYPEGQGELQYDDGRSYHGEFLHGQFQGQGRYETAGGEEVYEGQFERDDFSGQGTYTIRGGGRHEGHFHNWRPDGPGRYTDAQGDVYEGMFSAAGPMGPVHLVFKDGSRYDGEVQDWAPSGPGVLVRANGDTYRGNFAYGLFEGQGTLTYAQAQADGRRVDSGTWRLGKLDDPKATASLANVEKSLYSQRRLLDEALAAVAPRRPGSINLYLLAVAGDGSQEVFHREVDFVRAQFERRFDTAGHSVVLVNSRNTVERAPLATVTSIREALQALAKRMDRDQDILFLFLTSHGSRNREIALDMEGMRFPGLGAATLAQALRDSGIRWRVVVVSACYGGGFIEPLRDPGTLVITAARADRTSFGCADDNDFTYFGRAFFKESLPDSASFEDAFGRATRLIADWEDRDAGAKAAAVGHGGSKRGAPADADYRSLPQMEAPPAISNHLRDWWNQAAAGAR